MPLDPRTVDLTTQDLVPSVPVPIVRLFDFSDWQANHPTEPLPGINVDAEYDHSNDALNNVMARLALIQRDDGQLANNCVGPDQLDPAVFGELGDTLQAAVDAAEQSAADSAASALAASLAAQDAAAAAALIPTPVVPADVGKVPMVANDGHYNLQVIAGGGNLVSSVFGRLGAIVAVANDYTAAQVANVPAGGIAAATVQAAINELDGEKLGATLGQVSQGNVVAAGATQATATLLAKDMNTVTAAVAGVTDGVRLMAALAGLRVVVTNDAGVTVKVYPAVGEEVDNAAVNAPYLLAAGQTAEFLATKLASWNSNLGSMLSSANPLALDGVSPGVSTQAARGDHVHPAADLATAAVVGRLPYAKLVQQAAATILGNNVGALGDTLPLTVAQVLALLSVYTAAQVDALLANYANVNNVTTFLKALRGVPVALTAAAVTVPDFAAGNYFHAALNANYAVPNPTNTAAGQSGLFVLTQDATGGRVVTWANNYKFPSGAAPSNSLTPNAKDVIPYYVDAANDILMGNITADIR